MTTIIRITDFAMKLQSPKSSVPLEVQERLTKVFGLLDAIVIAGNITIMHKTL